MNSLRDPFSLRNQSALHILRQPLQSLHSEVQRTGAAVSRTAQKAQEVLQPALDDAQAKVDEVMSGFSVPRNVPSFTAAQRHLEDQVWSLKNGKSRDLPLYKDKPYYHSSRRSALRRKRYWLLFATLFGFLYWSGIFGGGDGASIALPKLPKSKSAPVDWEKRRQDVKDVFVESWAAYERDAWGESELYY